MLIADTDRAWAAGLFDGEGSACTFRGNWNLEGKARVYARCSLGQKDPRVLNKFFAIVGVGQIQERSANGQPFYEWSTNSLEGVAYIQNILFPYLGEVKTLQIQSAINKTTVVSGLKQEKFT